MILEIEFKPFEKSGEVIIESPAIVRVNVLASMIKPGSHTVTWYLSALPDTLFIGLSTNFNLEDAHPHVYYSNVSGAFHLYFEGTFTDGECMGIEVPLASVIEVPEMHPLPGLLAA